MMTSRSKWQPSKAGPFDRAHQPRQSGFAARLGEIGEQTRTAFVEHREPDISEFLKDEEAVRGNPGLEPTVGRGDVSTEIANAIPTVDRAIAAEYFAP
jgi:hypothetical protein